MTKFESRKFFHLKMHQSSEATGNWSLICASMLWRSLRLQTESFDCTKSSLSGAFWKLLYSKFLWNLSRIASWKLFSGLIHFLIFFIFFDSEPELFLASTSITSRVSWAIVSNKLKNHLSKATDMEEEKENIKGIWKKVKFCVFIFLSHKTTESYATKLGLTTDSTIHIHIAAAGFLQLDRMIFSVASPFLSCELLNWTFICVIGRTKGVKQSFIIESELKKLWFDLEERMRMTIAVAKDKKRTDETMNNFSLTIYI